MGFQIMSGFEFLISLLIPFFAFASGCERKTHFWCRLALALCICVGATFLIEWMNFASKMTTYYFSVVLYLGVAIASVCVCFKIDMFTALFILVGGYSMQHLSNSLQSIIFYYMERVDTIWGCLIQYSIILGCPAFVFFMFIKKNSIDYYVKKIDGVAILLAIMTLLMNFVVNEIAQTVFDRFASMVICKIYAIALCILVLYIEFSHLKQNKLQYEKTIRENLFKERQHQFDVFFANMKQMNIKFHDLKRQLSALEVMDSEEERKKYIKSLKDTLAIYGAMANTGNKALDTLLSEKSLHCVNNNIRFTQNVNGDLLSFMDVSDVYVLFSNALDNAIECLESEEDIEKRKIELLCIQKNNCVYINISNYCSGNIEFKNGLPKTQKDADYHGFGTKSIAQIVGKYDGILKMELKENTFMVEILFTLVR